MADVETIERPCSIGDCGKPAERVTADGVGLCAAHRKRLQRLRQGTGALPLDAPLTGDLSPLELVIVAADDFLDASTEDDREYELRLDRFREACRAWMRSEHRQRRRALEGAAEQVLESPGPPPEAPPA